MNKSESIKEIATAMAAAQAEMGSAKKGKDNPFFKSKYADISEVIKVIKEPFANNGLSYVQFPVEKDGRVGVETILMHSSGEFVSHEFTVNLSKQDAQGAGSAITYCRRYALQSIAGIPAEDDDGNTASQQRPQPKLQQNNQQGDDKPWYNTFDQDRENMIAALQTMTAQDVLNQLRETFKVNKEVQTKILALGGS
jgi:hypothetical protein